MTSGGNGRLVRERMAWDVFAKYLFPLKELPQAIYFVPSLGCDLALRREKEKSNLHPQHHMYYSVIWPSAPCPEDPREHGTGRQRCLQKFRPKFRLGRRFMLFFCLGM